MYKPDNPFTIVQFSATDTAGGASRVAWNLFKRYQKLGYDSKLIVGYRYSNDHNVVVLPNDIYRSFWARFWLKLINDLSFLKGRVPGLRLLRWLIRGIAEPQRLFNILIGREDYDYPGTWRIFELLKNHPKIIHCHNLHGRYFDLRALPWLSQNIPIVLTLQDAWLLSGHCAHSLTCERWKIGCGKCLNLTVYPAVTRDATSYNWCLKKKIYKKGQFYVAAPCQWLMRKVEQSILAPAIVEARVIANGIDLSVFHSFSKEEARFQLGIPRDVTVFLFVANRFLTNSWKDFRTLRSAVGIVAERLSDRRILFIALGDNAPTEYDGALEVNYIPYQEDLTPDVIARYYQAADICLFASYEEAETFPNTILEALACGIPVIATAVGGIPEQIEDGVTGFLVPSSDSKSMALKIEQLILDDNLRIKMGIQAAKSASSRFSLERQADEYLGWYHDILEKEAKKG